MGYSTTGSIKTISEELKISKAEVKRKFRKKRIGGQDCLTTSDEQIIKKVEEIWSL